MIALRNIFLFGAMGVVLAGCSTFNSLTGQVDNTVLPGQREEAIPGRSQFPEKQDVATASKQGEISEPPSTASTGVPEPACQPGDAACAPPQTADDTFSDPQ